MSKERRRERRRRNRRARRQALQAPELPHDRGRDGAVAPGTGITQNGRREIVLGHDLHGKIALPPYVELEDGTQVHPSRLKDYLRRRAEIQKKTRGGS